MFVVVAAALIGLVIYSQLRPQADFVSGMIEADEVRLGSRVGGRVKSVLVSEGAAVTPGMPLVEFEPYDLLEMEQQAVALLAQHEAALAEKVAGLRPEEIGQVKARYDQAVAELELLKAGPRAEEIATAQSRLEAAQADHRFADKEFQRLTELIRTNAVPRSDLDRSSEQLDAALANVEVRTNELKILQTGARDQEIQSAAAHTEDMRLAWELSEIGFRSEEIAQARAVRDGALASLNALRRRKSELTIVSPCAGDVDSIDLQPGDLVNANAPVLTIVSNRDLWVRAYVPQRFLQLQLGQSLRITVDAYPNEEFSGNVSYLSRQAEFTPNNVQTSDDRAAQVYRIRVTLDEHPEPLRPGMTVNVWLAKMDQE